MFGRLKMRKCFIVLWMQADFASIHVTASSDAGAVVNIRLNRQRSDAIE